MAKKKKKMTNPAVLLQNITRPTHEPRTDRGERCFHATPLGPAHLTPRVILDPETLDEWVSFVVSCSQQTDSHLAPSRVACPQRPPPQHHPLPTRKSNPRSNNPRRTIKTIKTYQDHRGARCRRRHKGCALYYHYWWQHSLLDVGDGCDATEKGRLLFSDALVGGW